MGDCLHCVRLIGVVSPMMSEKPFNQCKQCCLRGDRRMELLKITGGELRDANNIAIFAEEKN